MKRLGIPVAVRGFVRIPLALLFVFALHLPGATARAADRRPVSLDDLFALRDVSDPRVSPEGTWVAYTVTTKDAKTDKADSDLFMTSWDGARTVRLTTGPEKEHTPRFSPDGQFLSFLSSRGYDADTDQLWIMNRAGGEAERVTDLKGGVTDYAWSPDGKRIVLVVDDPEPEPQENKTPRPIVIDRFQFKQDESGYLGPQHSHLHLFDPVSRKTEALTSGAFSDLLPSWSPDGASLAFVSKRGPDPDRDDNWDIYVVGAKGGATARRLTVNDLDDCDPEWESAPQWSPDGKSILYLQGGPQKLIYYAGYQLAIVPVAGGAPRLLAPDLDRNVTLPRFAADGKSVYFLLEDDRDVRLARIPVGGGRIDRLTGDRRVIVAYDLGPGGRIAVQSTTPEDPDEVFALEGAGLRAVSRQNRDLMARLALGTTEGIAFKSKDGTEVHGLVVKPPDFKAGTKYPTILRIHGGPTMQYQNEFTFDWQLLAAHGYVVVTANPRGSTGRGEAYCRAIYADWGNKDAQDVLAAVDHVVAQGIADPGRLGVGGWSYGGMLTNYVIAQDTRFKAATSGASISNILAGYGTDQYIREYEAELGTPWSHPDLWAHVSFPFLHADRITTPTLFLCGDKDFNVPLLNSEQMYQALRSLGRDTRLVIYPGQHHGLTTPSYVRDRLERYLAWYDGHLMPKPAGGVAGH
ncbi:MAG TPA: S9 family peptidase [Candidatus Polarisedimenticolia bacterium]|nr:S9 family peptidase [Candidatus Polarisedimenticolia bacterium]